MNRFKLLLILTLVFYACFCNAQTAYNISAPDFAIFPKAPEAAAIAKYGSIPVNLSTGVPEISIPIWTISLKGLNVPISLNYNSSGIKVNEQASNEGLGWMLQSGGAVTATVFGKADFGPQGWVYSNPKTPQMDTYKEIWGDTEFGFPIDTAYQFYQNVLTGKADSQPDLFYANYLGKSVKFYYDQAGQIHLMPYKRMKIDTIRGPSGFRITDENDIVYTFGTEEKSTTTFDQARYFNEHGFSHVETNTTYYLTKIVTPAGDSVMFNYTAMGATFKNQTSESRSVIMNNCGGNDPGDRTVHSSTTIGIKAISSIVSSKGDSVVFNYNGANRLDLTGSHSLASIVIYKENNPAFSKTFTFAYNYFNLTAGSTTSPDAQDLYKLRLDTVRESGKGPYVFSYNDPGMPERLSFAQDHWGYYNGDIFNTTLLPLDSATNFNTGAFRGPDPEKCKAGILTTMKYPTGGKTVFNYEPNTYTRIKSFPVPNPTRVDALASNTVINNVNFTIPDGAYDFQVTYLTPSPPLDGLEPHNQFRTIQLKQGTTIVRQFSGSNDHLENLATPLSAGNYTFKLCIDTNSIGVYIALHYRLATDTVSHGVLMNVQTGGLRIKSTDDYAIDGTIALNTIYDYSPESDSTRSSNSIPDSVSYNYVSHVYWLDSNLGQYLNCDFNSQSSSNTLGLTGGPAYYDNVKVYKRSKSGNGYTNYSFLEQVRDGDLGWPDPPQIIYDWFNDQIIEQKEYKYNTATNTFNLLSKTANTYKTAYGESQAGNPHESFVRGIKIGVLRPGRVDTAGDVHLYLTPWFTIKQYNLVTSWFYQTKKEERLYDPIDTNKKVVTTTNYFFDNPDHIEVTREEISKSTGEHYNVLMRYPKDYNSSYPYLSSPVVEKRIMINDGTTDRLTKAELTLFKNHSGSFPI
ncbi:MAG TPA: hypothetical protein VL490_09960, partial [Mucilaginibacter sp.]|nr:hypothetical protein [Mucilaginibacter sp.]